MESKIIKAAEEAVATAVKTGQRVEVVPLKNEIKVNIVERKEVKLPD